MQSACRGILRLNARTAAAVSSSSRIGGNQRIAAALHTSALAHAHTNAHRVPAAPSPMPRPLVLRSEFSTLGGRWADKDKDKDKPKKKDNDNDDVQESRGKESPAKEDKDDKDDKDKDKDGKDKDGKDKDGKDDKDKKKKEEEEAPPPPPPHGDKSPLAVFYETLQSEFKKSQEWQESTKQLGQSAQQFSESPAVQKARQAYGSTAEAAGKVGEKTAQTLGKTAVAIGKGAAWTWETPVVKAGRAAARATGEGVAAVTKPVRDTKVYKDIKQNVEEVIDDGASSRYGGYLEREERKKQRELREMKGGARKAERMEQDPEAGTNVTLHKDAAWKESWREFRDSNKLMQSLFSVKRSYDESENPVISVTRNLADRLFSGLFAENETARVIRKFREMDAAFQLEAFLRELREYILPEVLDAYVRGETDVLRAWLSAAQFSVYAALNQQYAANGLRLDGKVLDIRNVDVLSARILEPGEVPVFIVSCRTQEVHVFRDVKTGELRAGMEDKVQQVTYAIGITRVPDEVANPETSGWRLIELQKSARDFI
ncbi:TIM23 translocase complex subunit Tim44 [Morchella snyderi]|nr:TIM23 translocase complex subunit Tim44 [Morchella snyderi]